MLLQKILTINLVVFSLSICSAQVQIDKPILLNGTSTEDRQIQNLGDPHSQNSALRAEDLKYGKYNFANSVGVDTIFLTFDPLVDTLIDGDLFFFQPSLINTNEVFLKCSFFPAAFPLLINGSDTIKRGQILPGKIIAAIYSGGKAYVITPINRTCPTGFVKVNENYCIEINERSTSNFFSAASTCFSQDAELCTWAEWYYACINATSLSLAGMTNNFEWLDDAANASLQVKVVGNGTCNSNTNGWSDTGNQPFRCCYRLK